jgi:cystathionine beta-lyase/cystathionine gamma-synthase
MPAITTAATFVMSGPEEIGGEPLYGRYGNPSRDSVEAVLASLEGAKHAMCFSSGNKIAISFHSLLALPASFFSFFSESA